MAADMPDTQEHTGPLSWRDLYRELRETEKRIVDVIERSVDGLGEKSKDHEDRIRRIESGELPWVNRLAEDASRTHELQGKRIGDLETITGMFVNRERGVIGTLGAGKQVILLIAAIVGGVVAAINLIALVTVGTNT